MNPDTPQNPRELLEMRVTALLLGELTPEEATALREVIAKDAELAALHERLKQTIELIRETAVSPAEETAEQPAPARMSEARREELLAQFKTIAPKEFAKPPAFKLKWLIPMSAAAAVMLLLSAMLLPALSRAKAKSQKFRGNFAPSSSLAATEADKESITSTVTPLPAVVPTQPTPPANYYLDVNRNGNFDVAAQRAPRANIVLPTTTDSSESAGEKTAMPALGTDTKLAFNAEGRGRQSGDGQNNRFYTGTTSDDVGGLRNLYRQAGDATSLAEQPLVQRRIDGNVNQADSFEPRSKTSGQTLGGTGSGGNGEKANMTMTAASSTSLDGYVDTSTHWNPGSGNANVPKYGFDSAGKADGFNMNPVLVRTEQRLREGAGLTSGSNAQVAGGQLDVHGTTVPTYEFKAGTLFSPQDKLTAEAKKIEPSGKPADSWGLGFGNGVTTQNGNLGLNGGNSLALAEANKRDAAAPSNVGELGRNGGGGGGGDFGGGFANYVDGVRAVNGSTDAEASSRAIAANSGREAESSRNQQAVTVIPPAQNRGVQTDFGDVVQDDGVFRYKATDANQVAQNRGVQSAQDSRLAERTPAKGVDWTGTVQKATADNNGNQTALGNNTWFDRSSVAAALGGANSTSGPVPNSLTATLPGVNAPIVSAPIAINPTKQSQSYAPDARLPVTPPVAAPANTLVGDPAWIGMLDQPDERHSASNQFIARNAYFPQMESFGANKADSFEIRSERPLGQSEGRNASSGNKPELLGDIPGLGWAFRQQEGSGQPKVATKGINWTGTLQAQKFNFGNSVPTPTKTPTPTQPQPNSTSTTLRDAALLNYDSWHALPGEMESSKRGADAVAPATATGGNPVLAHRWSFNAPTTDANGQPTKSADLYDAAELVTDSFAPRNEDLEYRQKASGAAAKEVPTLGDLPELGWSKTEQGQQSAKQEIVNIGGRVTRIYNEAVQSGQPVSQEGVQSATQNGVVLGTYLGGINAEAKHVAGDEIAQSAAASAKVNTDFGDGAVDALHSYRVTNGVLPTESNTSSATRGTQVVPVRTANPADVSQVLTKLFPEGQKQDPSGRGEVLRQTEVVTESGRRAQVQGFGDVAEHEKEVTDHSTRARIVLPDANGAAAPALTGPVGGRDRAYPNSTTPGPVQATYDAQTGKFIVLTDDKTFAGVNAVVQAIDRPTAAFVNAAKAEQAAESQKGSIPSPDLLATVPAYQSNKVATAELVQNGRFYLEMGDLDNAEAALKQVLTKEPSNISALHYLELAQERRVANRDIRNQLAARKALVQVESDWDLTQRARMTTAQPKADARGEAVTNVAKASVAPINETNRPYWTAKNELDPMRRAQEVADLRKFQEQIESGMQRTPMVTQVTTAQPEQASGPGLWGRVRESFGAEPSYSSRSRISIQQDRPDRPGVQGETLTAAYDPFFTQTESEVIRSERVLDKVVADLKLNEAWGKNGAKLSTEEARKRLSDSITLAPVRGTSLMDINVKTGKKEEAADIANAVAKAYADYRNEVWTNQLAGAITAFKESAAQNEQKIAQAQANVQRQAKVAAPTQTDVAAPKPALPPPVPQPEVLVRENAFSTFSLNVSDVSFKLAGASLDKGALPEPGAVRAEEFINAFDYRDPEPGPGVPIAFASERAHDPFAQNRDFLRFSVKTGAAGRQANRPLNIVLLLDNSGSMERADRVQIIHEALRVLASKLKPQDRVSVITFSRLARLWVDGIAGNQAGDVLDHVGSLTPEGGTNLEEAMKLAYATALRHYLANGMNRVVMLTDGAANLGNVNPASLKQMVETQRQQGVALDCFGVGWEGFNDDLLEELSRNGDGRYGFINSPEEAATEFAGQLAGALQVAASDVKVQVEFNPKRVSSYRQVGYAKHQLTKEQFRDNTVDAAEIAAAEAGNALYTVETDPAGEGPVATVRVRYRDPGTRSYYEKEWVVPYNGPAGALDQGSAAMRLTAASAAFAEWLAQSPFASEVSPDRLLAILSGVPAVYGADARPKKLETMIREAKSITGQ